MDKDVLRSIMYGNGKRKAVRHNDLLHPNYIIHSKNVSQKSFLRSAKRKGFSQNFLDGFSDSDGDGVVNGLDCFPFDKSKHGFFGDAVNYVASLKNKVVAKFRSENPEKASVDYSEQERLRREMRDRLEMENRLREEKVKQRINEAKARDDVVRVEKYKETEKVDAKSYDNNMGGYDSHPHVNYQTEQPKKEMRESLFGKAKEFVKKQYSEQFGEGRAAKNVVERESFILSNPNISKEKKEELLRLKPSVEAKKIREKFEKEKEQYKNEESVLKDIEIKKIDLEETRRLKNKEIRDLDEQKELFAEQFKPTEKELKDIQNKKDEKEKEYDKKLKDVNDKLDANKFLSPQEKKKHTDLLKTKDILEKEFKNNISESRKRELAEERKRLDEQLGKYEIKDREGIFKQRESLLKEKKVEINKIERDAAEQKKKLDEIRSTADLFESKKKSVESDIEGLFKQEKLFKVQETFAKARQKELGEELKETKKEVEKVKDSGVSVDSYRSLLKGTVEEAKREKELKLIRDRAERLQLQNAVKYTQYKLGESELNRSMLGLKKESEEQRYRYQISQFERMRKGNVRQFNDNFFGTKPSSVKDIFYESPSNGFRDRVFGFAKNDSKFTNEPIDVNKHRFEYVADINSFTRKSDYVPVKERGDMMIGQDYNYRAKFKKGVYPSTKPMQGFRRVYTGIGVGLGKGRRKVFRKTAQLGYKQKFTPYYGSYEGKGRRVPKGFSVKRFL